jgi:ATP-dependent helicase HrpA
VAAGVGAALARIVADVVKILRAARAVRERLDGLHGAAFDAVRRDVATQIGRLVYPGFITATGAARLPDVERYLRGAAWRLDRLSRNAAVDRDRMRVVQELEALYRQRAGDPALREVPWLLEELRISLFAQAIGPKGQVSARKIRGLLSGS